MDGKRVAWINYRWEFMRRSSEYKEAYAKFKELTNERSKVSFFEGFDGSGNQERTRELSRKIKEILNAFDMSHMLDPDKSFDGLCKDADKEAERLSGKSTEELYKEGTNMTSAILIHYFRPPSIEFLDPRLINPEIDLRANQDLLLLRIDISKVNSIEAFTDYLSALVKSFYDRYQSATGKKKKRLVDYETILKVGDMKTEGKTNQDIAKELFPEDFDNEKEDHEPNPETATKKVSNYFITYKRLINGGYKEMTYP
jgi:hypothetical protein